MACSPHITILGKSDVDESISWSSRWLVNLHRANHARQRASVDALRKVVIAARKTAVYMRQLDDTQ